MIHFCFPISIFRIFSNIFFYERCVFNFGAKERKKKKRLIVHVKSWFLTVILIFNLFWMISCRSSVLKLCIPLLLGPYKPSGINIASRWDPAMLQIIWQQQKINIWCSRNGNGKIDIIEDLWWHSDISTLQQKSNKSSELEFYTRDRIELNWNCLTSRRSIYLEMLIMWLWVFRFFIDNTASRENIAGANKFVSNILRYSSVFWSERHIETFYIFSKCYTHMFLASQERLDNFYVSFCLSACIIVLL